MGKKNISVIILAGGNSQRLSFPKPYLLFSPRITFLEKLVKEYKRFGCKEIIVVLNSESFNQEYVSKMTRKYSALFAVNKYPERGKLYSLKLGFDRLADEDYCFIQNIDNPFTNLSLLNKLDKYKISSGYSVPVFKEKGGHPILIGRKVIEGIKKTRNKDFNLRVFLNKYQRNEVTVRNEKITANINDLDDYRKYFNH